MGDYRVVCEIQEEKVLVRVLRVGHRSNVYGGYSFRHRWNNSWPW
ncbi:MAG: type II toxin-antitoxin system RelE family toxin [Thermodesulfobacteriota bacterium]